MNLSDDKRTLHLDISGPHTAGQLDSLIRSLALQRAAMEPAVAASRTDIAAMADDALLIEKEPSLSMAALRGGGFRLWVRNRGLGWLAYEINTQVARSIYNLIGRHTSGVEGVDLFGEGDGKTH